jgi:hypothetical protein
MGGAHQRRGLSAATNGANSGSLIWPAIDAWLRTPGLEIACAIPTITDHRRRLRTDLTFYLPGLLANHEMGKTVDPGAPKTCNRKMPQRQRY